MVKKIKKKVQKGPKGTFAIPLAMALTVLRGPERKGEDFRRPFEEPDPLREALQRHLDQRILLADRVLSPDEYIGWGYKSKPARLAEMFEAGGVIPMGAPSGSETAPQDNEGSPRLGLLPMIALVQLKGLDAFSAKLTEEMSEVSRTAFERAVYTALRLIPGYDLLLYRLPAPAQGLNHAIEALNRHLREASAQAAVPFRSVDFKGLPQKALGEIPLKEACFK